MRLVTFASVHNQTDRKHKGALEFEVSTSVAFVRAVASGGQSRASTEVQRSAVLSPKKKVLLKLAIVY